MVKETIHYYLENGGKPVHLLLLDARKAFDKVAYDMLFKVLIEKKCMSKNCLITVITITNNFFSYMPYGSIKQFSIIHS